MSENDRTRGGAWSRREWLKRAAAGTAGLAGGATAYAQGRASDRRDDDRRGRPGRRNKDAVVGDAALVNGTFIDGRGIVASAMTIRNGRIAKVDRLDSVGPDTPVVN